MVKNLRGQADKAILPPPSCTRALAHESPDLRNQPLRDGCAFDTLFQTTPQELIDGGLYNTLAEPFVSGEAHRKLSYALLAKKLGAVAKKGRPAYSRSSLSSARSSKEEVSATAEEQNV